MAVSQAIQEEVLKEAYSVTPNYSVDPNDERLTSVNDERDTTLSENKALYGDMIASSDDFYTGLQEQQEKWAQNQVDIQNQQTDFAIEKIEQQKEQAEKDYLKEQSGAYVDWQKQSNKYGVEAEKMASAGLTNTGYSESSQVSMYNTYQNRVATAREVLAKAKLNYDNGIKEAMLQNNAAIAEIWANCYLKQAELALEGFQYKNELILAQANKELEIKNMYHNQWMDALNQINTENAMAEEVRQYNETQKWNTEQAQLNRDHDEELEKIKHDYNKELAQIEQDYKIAYLDAQTTKQKEVLDKEHTLALEKLEKEREEKEKLLKYEYDLKAQSVKITGSSGSGSKATMSNVKNSVYNIANNSKVSSGTDVSINAKSKLSLGKGPISDAKTAEMVNNGKAKQTVKNGQVYVEPATYIPTKLQKLQSTVKTNKGNERRKAPFN